MNKNNTSGYVGVSYDAANKKYKAYYNIAGDKIRLGLFQTAEAANSAREVFLKRFKESDNKLLTYLQIKVPGVSESVLKMYIIDALKEYINDGEGCMFYGYCKNYILNQIRMNRMPVFDSINWEQFEKKLNDITRPIVMDGKSISKTRDKASCSYDYVIEELKRVFAE